MNEQDVSDWADWACETAGIVKEYVAKVVTGMESRVAELEAREPATPEDIRAVVAEHQASWALDFERRAQDILARAIAAIPMPKNGASGERGPIGVSGPAGPAGNRGPQGERGTDALDIEDMTVDLDVDGRTVIWRFARGDIRKEFAISFPTVLDRGVYRQGESYVRGDAVTFGGSLWIAQCPTSAKPETNADWRLACKRGRDGKDAR